jgi:serine phosphatase RsbU (regulator of sigma subunit)
LPSRSSSSFTDQVAAIIHEYRPSGPVGGDFFCLLPFSETRVGIFIADVMGQGVGAALTLSALNAMASSEAARLSQPDAFLKRLNGRLLDVIAREGSFEFITAFDMVIDTLTEAFPPPQPVTIRPCC